MTALELVYQYRVLLGKCETGAGLDFDEIEALGAIEALFASTSADHDEELLRGRRQFARERVSIQGLVRGTRLNDPVHIVDVGPGGMVCKTAPYIEEGQLLEVVIDDEELGLSYRFKACVSWLRDDVDDDYSIGLRFVGTPLLIHRGPQRDHADDVDAAIAA